MNSRTLITASAALLAGLMLIAPAHRAVADDSGYGRGESNAPRSGPLAEARELIEMGSFGSAIWSLKRVIEETPQNADAHNLLAFSYRKIERFELAERHYAEALRIAPDHAGAHAYQGVLFLETGRDERARHNLERLRAICGSDCEEYRNLRSAIETTGPGA